MEIWGFLKMSTLCDLNVSNRSPLIIIIIIIIIM